MGCLVVSALASVVLVIRGRRFVAALTLLLGLGVYLLLTPSHCWLSPSTC
jgi:hypothetical protein